ncbi:hypothetical protein [Streptomyces sp. NPDC058579]|uniref:hypothetical protein n=1 Tax=Streptomyces sp. NPDC058579 TaxID=3346548 RepID=UPI00364E1743
MAWRSLVERCEAVTDNYLAGRWLPSLCEVEVAEALGRTTWSETTMTTSRDAVASVPTGLTAGLLAAACIQQVTLENQHLRQQLDDAVGVTALSARRTARATATGRRGD